MRTEWLVQYGSDRLLVVFGGWALGAAPFAHLIADGDVLFVDDYREITRLDLAGYGQVDLVAYSYGVAGAGHWIAAFGDPFARKVAVNGSLFPCDETRGIAPEMVRKTAAGLSDKSLAAFARRCGADAPDTPDIPALQAELLAILARGAAPHIRFDHVWLSGKDRIFPAANLHRAWDGQSSKLTEIDAPHAPFKRWQSWAEVMS